MSFVLKLMIGGWAATLAMITVCALNESGRLFRVRKRITSWVQPSDARYDRTEKGPYPGTVQTDFE